MKQIFLASTYFEVVGLAAGIDAGAYDTAVLPALAGGGADVGRPAIEERILVVSDHTLAPELAVPLDERPGMAPLLRRFDRFVRLNELLAPLQPSEWRPREEDLPLLERSVRAQWGLGSGSVELVLESPQVNPAIALARIFRRAPLRVHADGLMSYGPTRSTIPLGMGQRLTSLHYLPLAPGLRPRLLTEFAIAPVALDAGAFRAVVAEIAAAAEDDVRAALPGFAGDRPSALIVGQYLAALRLMTQEEEEDLHVSMLEAAQRRGIDTVVFKPHPAAPPTTTARLEQRAAQLDVELHVLTSPVIAEAVMALLRPTVVIGGFSTALASASALFDTAVEAVGTETILARLKPYQNSNRIPATIVDASFAAENPPALQKLIDAVAYCMQPQLAGSLRPAAERLLPELSAQQRRRWFRARRTQALQLPTAAPKRRIGRSTVRAWGRLALEATRLHLPRA
ncbi:hypothetical protein GSY69_03385 [Brevibacterium sp. 5221]|uniref:Uncharacterized protein n=1 Tax=Brevibacterium rongguiense TaxID=2695267 RepID=A0A6N9H5C4_9MICO|nr:polysialyltransferase family glycosyltransferase [Brevibacterium rongguiense]MYM19041.1 hypothetical protein [Brevibacterium rongguiense]